MTDRGYNMSKRLDEVREFRDRCKYREQEERRLEIYRNENYQSRLVDETPPLRSFLEERRLEKLCVKLREERKRKIEEEKKEKRNKKNKWIKNRSEREKKIKIIFKKSKILKIYCSVNIISILILYLLLLWENISTTVLIENNFLGVIYKDFNCTNWNKYISNVSPEIIKKCKKKSFYDNKKYFVKDNVSINYPNLWILNDNDSLKKYNSKYNKKYNKSNYCKEFIETETLVHYGFSRYQKYKPIKNANYENEINPPADKYFNRILVTKMKLFIKNKKEVDRCIPKKYIIDNSVIINRVGTSIGHTHCNVEPKLFSRNIYNNTITSDEVTYNFGFKVPDVDAIYIVSKIIIYPLLYVLSYSLLPFLIHMSISEDLFCFGCFDKEINNEKYDLKKLSLLLDFDYNNYRKIMGFSNFLSKLLIGFLFYYIDVINNYICDLEDGKIQCYVNRLTVNTYLGYGNLRPQNCYNKDLMDSFGSFHFLEVIINSFLLSFSGLILPIICFCYITILDPKFLEEFNENDETRQSTCWCCCIQQLSYSIWYCICCWSKKNFCCMRILGVFSPIMFIFSLIIILLFDIASIFIFLGTLFSGNWEMLYLKLPNFEGLDLDLGVIYNKNIIFLIKIIFYCMLIIYDLSFIFYAKVKEIKDNRNSDEKEESIKEIEMTVI